MADLRIGIIGAGGIARRHVQELGALDGVRVTAVVDLDPARARRLAAVAGARVAGGLADALSDIDAAYVLTPPRARIPIVAALAAAGVPVFCEKPLAASVDDAEALAEAVTAAGTPFMVGFMRRWHPANLRLRDLLRSGAIGEPVQFFRRRVGRLDLPPGDWRTDAAQLCGVTVESASHDLDLLRWLAGDIADATGVVSETRPDLPGYDESMAATLRFAGGATGVLQVSWRSGFARNELSVIGTEGTVVVTGDGMWTSRKFRVERGGEETIETLPDEIADDEGYRAQASAFVALARGEAVDHPGVEDGLATVVASHRILASAAITAGTAAGGG